MAADQPPSQPMPVTTSTSRVQYDTNGTTGPWSVPFYFLSSSDLLVVYANADGVEDELTLTTDYSVTGAGDEDGGSVTTVTAYASGGTLTIVRSLAITQSAEFTDTDPFPAATLNRGLDRQTMISQQLNERVDRAITLPVSDEISGQLPDIASRASKLLGFNSAGEPIAVSATTDSAAALALQLASRDDQTEGAGQVGFDATLNYVVGTIGWHAQETYYAADFPWNVQPGLTTDQGPALKAAIDYVESVGGTLKLKPGTYRCSSIDLSGLTVDMVLDGQGAVLIPFSASQGQVLYCNNSTGAGTFARIPIEFRNLVVRARLATATSDTDVNGHCDYGVNFISSSAKWWNSRFQYGRIAAYRGYYHQYGEFWSCQFDSAVYANTTAGCLLDGNGTAEASNENRFFGPRLFSCKNGLVIKGGIKNRVYSVTIQDIRAGGTAGIWLTADGTGFGTDGTQIDGAYTEVNAIPAITVGIAPNTLISGAEMVSAGESITATHCYNLSMRDVTAYNGGTVTVTHPSADALTASFTMSGGNVSPSISGLLAHTAGPTYYDIQQPAMADFRSTTGRVVDLVYSASIAIDARAGGEFVISATNTSAFTVNNPTGMYDGQEFTIRIKNTSGGVLGAVTWGSNFKMSAWTSPANGFNRLVNFRYRAADGKFWEVSRVTADIPN